VANAVARYIYASFILPAVSCDKAIAQSIRNCQQRCLGKLNIFLRGIVPQTVYLSLVHKRRIWQSHYKRNLPKYFIK
jgi:hypothetical protein